MTTANKPRKLLFSAIVVLLVYLFAEAAAYIGYAARTGELFSWSGFQKERRDIISGYRERLPQMSHPKKEEEKKRGRTEVIHPYLGYVIESQNEECSQYGFCDWRVVGAQNAPVTPRDEGKFVVGVFGGSFAHGVSTAGTRGYFEAELGKIPALKGKEIVIHTIAMGGYKQPQQLMALNYFLLLGAQFDLVINIDGFNEVALPPFENLSKQVFPSYPRNWFNRVGKISDLNASALIGMAAHYEKERARWSETFSEAPLRYSVIANLVWLYGSNRYLRKARQAETDFSHYRAVEGRRARYVVHGPPFEYDTEADVYGHLAQVWSRSSLQMAAVAEGLGIPYLHFLQPNQYVEGSKPMSEEERKIAVLENHPYQYPVEAGYPYLIAEGEKLKRQGVNFHDLTLVFQDNEEILYRDQCCHLNRRGHDLMVDRVMEEVRKLYP